MVFVVVFVPDVNFVVHIALIFDLRLLMMEVVFDGGMVQSHN